ncbi:hypothetical protein D9M72_589730 [compost metagenome]
MRHEQVFVARMETRQGLAAEALLQQPLPIVIGIRLRNAVFLQRSIALVHRFEGADVELWLLRLTWHGHV